MEETPIAIHIENLSKFYPHSDPERPALKNINLQIPLGKIWCLLGPNGSGKTSLLKILAGLLTQTEGTVSIMGLDPAKSPLQVRSHIGWMPADERSGFYGRLSVKDNLTFFAALQNVAVSEVDRSIGNLAFLLDFNDELDKSILKTSSGGRQKVGLARVLLHNPSILLLDEPLRNLDPHAIMRVRRLLKDHLARKNKNTVLMTTHQLEEARRIADHIVIIREGEVVKSISARDLEAELKDKSVEDFYIKTIDSAAKK